MQNNLTQLKGSIDGVVVGSLMTAEEARQCIEEIKGHLRSLRSLLLILDERRGWFALGYSSMRQCMVEEFGRSQSKLYRELKAGKIERKISPMGEIGIIPERQLREVGKLPPEQWFTAWEQVVKTAPDSGVTSSHVALTVAKIKKLNNAFKEQDFVLGERVKVRTRRRSSSWNGMEAVITKIEEYEITLRLDDDSGQVLRFYRDELIKINAPDSKLNQTKGETIQRGDLVAIAAPSDAEFSQRLYNGCWGTVASIEELSIEVVVKGKSVRFIKSDVKQVDNPAPILVDIARKLDILFNRQDLDELDRQILEFYVGRFSFTDRQLERLGQVWNAYQIK